MTGAADEVILVADNEPNVRMMVQVSLEETVQALGSPDAFVGHIGGDFMFTCRPEEVTRICEQVVVEFERRIGSFYDEWDWDRGYVELPDRQGQTQRRAYRDHREIVEVATEMKAYLKHNHRRSAYAVDGRASPPVEG